MLGVKVGNVIKLAFIYLIFYFSKLTGVIRAVVNINPQSKMRGGTAFAAPLNNGTHTSVIGIFAKDAFIAVVVRGPDRKGIWSKPSAFFRVISGANLVMDNTFKSDNKLPSLYETLIAFRSVGDGGFSFRYEPAMLFHDRALIPKINPTRIGGLRSQHQIGPLG